MKTLFFDFETTGVLLRREPLSHPDQPRAVSVGMLLVADGIGTIGQAKFMIKPSGFTIPDDVVKIHGITTEIATQHGVPCQVAMQVLNHFAHKADECVAFNADFDYKLLQIESMRIERAHHMPLEKVRCCMLPYKDLLKIPGRYGDYKWPSLDEVCGFLGIVREGGHDALGDVYTTMRVWYELKRKGLTPNETNDTQEPQHGQPVPEVPEKSQRSTVPSGGVSLPGAVGAGFGALIKPL